MFQLEFKHSIALYDQAMANYKAIDDDDGVGRTLISRGISLWKINHINEALEHERTGLRLLAPNTPTVYHTAALTNIAQFLATADEKHFINAEAYCVEFRDFLAGHDGLSAVRVRVSWSHGLILARLGERKRALQMLRKARNALMRARQDAEVIAITADIIYIYCDSERYHLISKIVADTIKKVGDSQGNEYLLKEILHAADWKLEETRTYSARLRDTVDVSVPFFLSVESPQDASFAP